MPTFGPGSPGFISEGMKRLGLEEGVTRLDLGLGTTSLEGGDQEKRLALSLGSPPNASTPLNPNGNEGEEGRYAGAGAYY